MKDIIQAKGGIRMNFLFPKKQSALSGSSENCRKELHVLLEPHFDRVLTAFYAQATADEALRQVKNKGPGVEHLKRAQIAHWDALLTAEQNDNLRLRCEYIGDVHRRVGLSIAHYIGSYSAFFKAFTQVIQERHPRDPKLMATLSDAVFFDINAALTGFLSASESHVRIHEARTMAESVECEMKRSDDIVDAQSTELRRMVDELNLALATVKEGVGIVKQGTEAAGGGIQAVAAAVTELHASSQEVGCRADSASRLAHDAVTKADEAERKIASLADATARVAEIVKLIASISKQTNLLALNATIEASRAGENGRGFAVVASEVKQLSRRTEQATRDISSQINEIEVATKSAVSAVKEVRDTIRGIDEIATAVATSSGDQIDALRELGVSAMGAAAGANDLGESVKLFTEAVTDADRVADNVSSHARQVGTLFERLTKRLLVTVRSLSAADPKRHLRSPAKVPVNLLLNDAAATGEIVEISEFDALVVHAPPGLAEGTPVDAQLSGIGHLTARIECYSAIGLRLRFVDVPEATRQGLSSLMQRLMDKESQLKKILEDYSGRVEAEFNRALKAGETSLDALFDANYAPISGTDPKQYRTKSLDYLERALPSIQEPVLNLDPTILYFVAVDGNGYLPVHNKRHSAPQGADKIWNAAHCRNRRFFDGPKELAAARNTNGCLVQTYPRDMGAEGIVITKDISIPIFIDGRHWGGLRLGAKIN